MANQPHRDIDPTTIPKVSRAQADLFKVYADYDLKRETRATVHTFVKRLPYIVASICFMLCVKELAGRETRMALVAWITGLELTLKLSWSLTGALGLALGSREWVYRKQIKRLGKEKQDLEARLDPKRSSSGLAETGVTKPEDE